MKIILKNISNAETNIQLVIIVQTFDLFTHPKNTNNYATNTYKILDKLSISEQQHSFGDISQTVYWNQAKSKLIER